MRIDDGVEGLKRTVPGASWYGGGWPFCPHPAPPHAAEQGRGGAVTWRRGVDVEGWGVERSQRLGFQSAHPDWA